MIQRALQQHPHVIALTGIGQRQHLAEHTLAVEPMDMRLGVRTGPTQQVDHRGLISVGLGAE